MSSGCWFKPKAVGYGNVPHTWQGWTITIVFVLFVLAVAAVVQVEFLPKFWALAVVLAVTAVYLPFIRAKTDGEWRWRSRADRD